ncbi:hypothetical protein [Nitrosopumilus adriaticus]|uniref:CARDB domain-containing protein n=1 Tax=Nitrosopumilus adriaticus TaxID=1580092 RepID=A0A0D5C323_9ARCH|nr:hypothetical protein [Nitrosopumilus adriaticus]AJW70740.1 hypothetical protein NADRNF5_1050 [Nitrosopumilus adriaticus]
MVAGFSVLSLALDAQTDIVTTQRIVSDVELKKQQERFGIAVSTDSSNKLDISVTNFGQNPVEISSFWIINKTLATQPATRYTVNYDDSFVTGGIPSSILASQTLYMIPDSYDIKVMSSLGTIEIAELVVGPGGSSVNNLRSVLVTDPPDVILGQNVTIAMVVTNTGQLKINDVAPSNISVNPSGVVVGTSGPNLPSVDLIPGESFLFLWDYNIDGTADTSIDFSNFATGLDVNNNLIQSNIASDKSVLRDSANSTSEELIVLTQDLLAKPELFIVMPAPFGESGQQGVWGINVVNPIEKDLEVSKIVITATSTRYTGGDEIFTDNNGNACQAEHVDLSLGGTWSCPMPNQLMWKSLSSPVSVPGLSTVPFLALVEPGFIGSSGDFLETVPVDVSVYTTLGQFGKSGYGTSYNEGSTTLPNVYLTDVPGSSSNANILSSIDSISSGSVVKLNATLTDFDDNLSHVIQATDSRLIINVPKGWTSPSIINAPGFTMDPIETFADGSSQIVGVLNSDISSTADTQTIEFQVTAPTVTSTQLYVMYVLADGISSGDVAIGPLAEIVLQVIP